jgi:hypothetical protein
MKSIPDRSGFRVVTAALAAAFVVGCSTPQPSNTAQAASGADKSGAVAAVNHTHTAEKPTMVVYKSPTCGCCTAWVDHVEANGFRVEVRDTVDVTPVKARHGLPANLASCHTALVDGYVVEGHVPADLIVRMLRDRPDVAGIAVPGMPMGSPGMEGPYKDRYEVLTFKQDGSTAVYATR